MIVVLPMIGVGFLVSRLIGQSENGQADARAGGMASTAASVYRSRRADARADAAAIARAVSTVPAQELAGRVRAVAALAGLARVMVSVGPRLILDRGDRSAVAPGTAAIHSYPAGPVAITTSELTAVQYARGLTNHGRFHEQLSRELEEARRYHHPVGLIMLDIDNFKSFNDSYGHQQGDVVLRDVARVLRDTSREVDVPARYGGEELALILPHTDLEGSYAIAERVRRGIEGQRVSRTDGKGERSMTASIGVSVFTGGDKNALIADADAALYEAKRRGKNRTVRAKSGSPNVIGAE